MKLLLLLLLAHFIGDFVLQPNEWVKSKFKKGLKSLGFWKHILAHALLLFLIGLILPAYALPLLTVLVGHIVIDAIKITYLRYSHNETSRLYAFIVDQILHILLIFGVVINTSLNFNWLILSETSFLLILLGYLFLSLPTSSIMKVLLSPYNKEIDISDYKSWKDLFFTKESDGQQSLKNGGKYIGILERILVFTFIIIGQWSAVGFLITAKSVFRFGDLNQGKNRQFTEYVLIGTLLSFGFAIFTAILVQYFLNYI